MKRNVAMSLFRFSVGFIAVAVTCVFAMEREVWRAQLVILLSISALAGVACAIWSVCARAIKDHWIL
jgi:hypothetical protein